MEEKNWAFTTANGNVYTDTAEKKAELLRIVATTSTDDFVQLGSGHVRLSHIVEINPAAKQEQEEGTKKKKKLMIKLATGETVDGDEIIEDQKKPVGEQIYAPIKVDGKPQWTRKDGRKRKTSK